jgi:hypothetical protein
MPLKHFVEWWRVTVCCELAHRRIRDADGPLRERDVGRQLAQPLLPTRSWQCYEMHVGPRHARAVISVDIYAAPQISTIVSM